MLWISLLLLLGLIPSPRAQDPPAKADSDLLTKVRAGGNLHTPRWRRGDDGALGFVLRVANTRLDHSHLSVTVRKHEQPPFRLWYQAAGAFEAELGLNRGRSSTARGCTTYCRVARWP
jgi:hypothetical protein